mgnify:CR=1 FL=1
METYADKNRRLSGFKNDLKRKATNEKLILKNALEKEGIYFHFQKCFFNDSLSCILDFYFNKYSQRLAVEIDGDQHLLMEQIEKDRHRTEWLMVNRKCKVIRFTNSEITSRLDHCLAIIKTELGL